MVDRDKATPPVPAHYKRAEKFDRAVFLLLALVFVATIPAIWVSLT